MAEKRDTQIGVRLPDWIKEELVDIADSQSRTLTSLVERILTDWLQERIVKSMENAEVSEPRKPRKANKTMHDLFATSTHITFKPEERRILKTNKPGPSGQLGGYQRFENWLVENTNEDGSLRLPPDQLARLIHYIKNYGDGGPNRRIREAAIPALRRAGIDVSVWN